MVEENLTPDPEQESSSVKGSPPPDDSSQEENLEQSESDQSADVGASEQAIPSDEIESPDVAEDEAERLMMEELAKSESSDYQAPETSPDDVSEEEAERQMMAELSKVESQSAPEEATMVNSGITGAGIEETLVAQPAEFGELKQDVAAEHPRNIEILMDVKLPISIELGRTEMTVNDILELTSGSVVELNKLAGETVDLLVNNKIIAKGEVVVVDENFGLRITTLLSAEERIKSL